MNIADTLSKNLGIKKLTGPALKEAVISTYAGLSDAEKRRVNHEIAHEVIKATGTGDNRKKCDAPRKTPDPENTRVLAINHTGPLDITIEWRTGPDGALILTGYRRDAGGDQINVSKVFSHFDENIALVALAGKEGSEITDEWEKSFMDDNIIPVLIRDPGKDQQVAVYNVIDHTPLPGMFEWADELSKETVADINQQALSMLEKMSQKGSDNIWMVLSAGGPLKYNKNAAYYASLVKEVKAKYSDKIKLMMDFKFMSGPEEAISVLDIPRDTPQDMIKPNLEEFLQILISSGLAKPGMLDIHTITEKDIKEYAARLRDRYNLLGVFVSLDKDGLMLVTRDRVIREKGIKIHLASHTAAGDSLKAGVLYALSKGRSFEEAVHTGNLFGASTASMEGSQTVTPVVLAVTEDLARKQNVVPETGSPGSGV